MLINCRWIKFNGLAEVPIEPDRLKNLIVSGEFDLQDYREKPNEDGTVDAIYTARPIRIMVQDGDNKVRLKVKNPNSKRLKQAIWHEYTKRHIEGIDDEIYYDRVMDKLIANLETILDNFSL
jgi:hypothetical protein